MAKLLDSISYMGGMITGIVTVLYLLLLIAIGLKHLIYLWRKRK